MKRSIAVGVLLVGAVACASSPNGDDGQGGGQAVSAGPAAAPAAAPASSASSAAPSMAPVTCDLVAGGGSARVPLSADPHDPTSMTGRVSAANDDGTMVEWSTSVGSGDGKTFQIDLDGGKDGGPVARSVFARAELGVRAAEVLVYFNHSRNDQVSIECKAGAAQITPSSPAAGTVKCALVVGGGSGRVELSKEDVDPTSMTGQASAANDDGTTVTWTASVGSGDGKTFQIDLEGAKDGGPVARSSFSADQLTATPHEVLIYFNDSRNDQVSVECERE